MADFDAAVIGAGAVGLACTAALGDSGMSMLVIEAEGGPGEGTSSRNSEVVHAGFYYPRGSLKHLLCVRGRRLLYPFLAVHRVSHRKCGKLVVATSQTELAAIERLAERAAENEVEGISLLTAAETTTLEPDVRSVGALFSAETGIMDSHGYMLALEARIAAADGLIAYRSPFVDAEPINGGFRIRTGGDDPALFTAARLINSAGLAATRVAARIAGLRESAVPRLRLAKGNYFGLSGRAPFTRLVYPAPVDGGLGVHATLDLAGRVRFGPDVEWLDAEFDGPERLSFAVDPRRADSFYEAVRRYWPALPAGALFADYAGVRPKLFGPGQPAADFRIDGPETHELSGLINLFGIESPGLTASLAIAENVLSRLA
jgi:L-2-hydroxyglutarate oxidase LhgO